MTDRRRSDFDQALAVETSVVEDSGQWRVEIVVLFADKAVHHAVNTYRSRRRAEIAASWMKRAADRSMPDGRAGPPRRAGGQDE